LVSLSGFTLFGLLTVFAKKGTVFGMSQDHLIKLKSTKSAYTYYTRKNRKKVERKLEYKKFDPTIRKTVAFKEAKK